MKKQRIILISGIALIVVALFALKIYVDQIRTEADIEAKAKSQKYQASQVMVLIAKRDIDKGVAIDIEDLQTENMPSQFVQPQAVTSFDRISGMITLAPISKGEQITLSKLAYQRAGNLASITPVGKRAVSIAVDNISSLSGMIKGGDYVDVIGMIPVSMQTPDGKTVTQIKVAPLFQNILVLAVGQDMGMPVKEESRYKKQESTKEASPLITLALSPQEASLITFVQEQSKIRLVLRSPTDAKIESVQPASWDTLSQYIMPGPPAAGEAGVKPQEEEGEYVEIYRGLNKEKVPLR
ncbi:MAG: Flp pilus assembly protein CpaB [Candidatus Omnitrophica bacterium]|nr:Flp pilus assembly protein CpaB [Candidatus Omnitrophota bacterium]